MEKRLLQNFKQRKSSMSSMNIDEDWLHHKLLTAITIIHDIMKERMCYSKIITKTKNREKWKHIINIVK